MIRLYNTLTRQIDEFKPAVDDRVSLYTCGPTVYNYPTVGNWTSYIYWDTLVRMLVASGYSVERVMNLTDVGHLTSDADEGEDKLEKGARREGKTAWEVAEFYAEDFLNGMEQLAMRPPEHIVRATEFIPQQLDLVRILKEKGFTYQTTDGIYFDTAKFPDYAKFANLQLEAQKAGARVDINDEKRQAWDFALWKFTPNGQQRDMEWATPADLVELPPDPEQPIMGFPGWHLECSAMAMSILGPTIDIHTGGIDHIPVHHTNEIAQSQAASDQLFSRFWLHCNHIKINGAKISKSLGNGYTLQDIINKGFTPLDLRLFVLQGHYQSEGNFTWEGLEAARNRRQNWRNFAALRHQTHDRLDDDSTKQASATRHSLVDGSQQILNALQDNLGTPQALKTIDQQFSQLDGRNLDQIHHYSLSSFIAEIDDLLGLGLADSTPDIDDHTKKLLLERQRAREAGDWKKSDRLRDQLIAQNITVRDTSSGTIWGYAG